MLIYFFKKEIKREDKQFLKRTKWVEINSQSDAM